MENTTEVTRVGFGSRLGALLLDVVIVFGISFVLSPILGGFLGAAAATATAEAAGSTGADPAVAAAAGGIIGTFLALIVVLPLVYVVYYLIEGLTGITLGKLILGIKVANQDGTAAPIGTLITRWAVKASGNILSLLGAILGVAILGTVGSIVGLVIFIGCFFVLGAKKQALHDLVAKTAVFKKSDIK
ncbi:RDD family protein [Cytophaga aurantiaca]|uniref:RDD family protein n=1 Tax=Cytophaga aurantiaca TaxID=29530 RepID=UPI00036EBE4F|nr:RDD family protein [Cytophaga aurantiaca]